MIIGRHKEREQLDYYYDVKETMFICLMGRLRVGKTFLINKHFENRIYFGCTAEHNDSNKELLNKFSSSLGLKDGFKDWIYAWSALQSKIKNDPSEEKKVIFIDEFPWFSKKGHEFISYFSNFWNGFACSRDDILLIISGSSARFLIDKVIKSQGGLYNRVEGIINLKPFTLKECKEYMASKGNEYSNLEIADGYNVFGGIPHYWSLIAEGEPIQQAINRLFITTGYLKDEFNTLFQVLFDNNDIYKNVVKILGSKDRGMTRLELIKELNVPDSGNFSKVLNTLEISGLIKNFQSFPKPKRDSFYQLIDNFCYFNVKNFLDNITPSSIYWDDFILSRDHNNWQCHAFEKTIYNHFNEIIEALGLNNFNPNYSNFQNSSNQTELIITRKDKAICLLEVTFADNIIEIDWKMKEQIFERTKCLSKVIPKSIYIQRVLLSPFGAKPNELYILFDNYITLDDLIVI